MLLGKLTAVIIDDEEHCREALGSVLQREHPEVVILGQASDVRSGLELVLRTTPQVIFLDIEIGEHTGFELLQMLGHHKPHVIFTTAHVSYAVRAIRFSAIDFLLKPIDAEELNVAILKARETLSRPLDPRKLESLLVNLERPGTGRRVSLPVADGLEMVAVDDITGCKAHGQQIEVQLRNGKRITVLRTLKEFEDLLDDSRFVREGHASLTKGQNGERNAASGGANGKDERKTKPLLIAAALVAVCVVGGFYFLRPEGPQTRGNGPPPPLNDLVTAQDPAAGGYHAILFASENYAPHFADLDHPIADAEALRTVLTEQYKFDDVELLKDPSRTDILEKLTELNQRLTANDNLLIFYAGHGDKKWTTSQRGAWIPAGATASTSTWVSQFDILEQLESLKAKHVLLLMDACFGGSFILNRGTMRSGESEGSEGHYYSKRSCKAMTSGADEEVQDRSLFMQYLVASLRASSDKEFVRAESIFRMVTDSLEEHKEFKQVPQHAPIQETPNEGGDFVFVRRDR
jgi:two-component system LytT family response regulator